MTIDIVWGNKEIVQQDPELLRESFNGHPLDNPKVQEIIKQHAPEFLEKIKTCTRQKMSEHPDELEKWETEAILQRQRKYTYETDYGYVLRVLYEELFSVNQWPDEKKGFISRIAWNDNWGVNITSYVFGHNRWNVDDES